MSPFNQARYKRLLEGLEVSEIQAEEVRIGDRDGLFRWDSEYFQKDILQAKAAVDSCASIDRLGGVTRAIEHPVEVQRRYDDNGTYRILLAQEVRPNQIILGNGNYLRDPGELFLKTNRLYQGDMVLTRTGANFGQCAPVLVNTELFACADLLVMRKGELSSSYISSFLSSSYGRLLLDRGSYGMAQPHIAPTYLRHVPIPVFTELMDRIDDIFVSAARAKKHGNECMSAAEQTLMQALGLTNWQPPEPQSYVRSSGDAFVAGRLDAEYFTPKVEFLLNRLGRDGTCIGDVAPPRHEKFRPARMGTFDYIEIGSLTADGSAVAKVLEMREAPSRATQHARAGDVITSTVRPIRRLSALIDGAQAGAACSSGFVVLDPQIVSAATLLTYLRLPVICELMNVHTTATMYPAISEADLLALPFPNVADDVEQAIQHKVRESSIKRAFATDLLEAAKHAVEIAIENSEGQALAFLKEATQP